MAEGANIRKTVSLDPFVERMVRRLEAEMLNSGFRTANFSLGLNFLILYLYFDQTPDGDHEVFHKDTIRKVREWFDGSLQLSEKDFQKWSKLVERVLVEPEANLNNDSKQA